VITEDLAWLIADRGHGLYVPASTTSTIFLGRLPDQPDEAIAIASYAGPPGDAALPLDRPRIQFAVRGTTQYLPAAARAQRLYDDLTGLASVSLRSGAWLSLIHPVQSGPVDMPPTSRDRIQFVLNFGLHLSRATTHRSY
jgi:hypothetical protein